MNFKLILFSIENNYTNNDQTSLKTDDGNKASIRNDNREQLRREEEKGKDHCCFKWLVCR